MHSFSSFKSPLKGPFTSKTVLPTTPSSTLSRGSKSDELSELSEAEDELVYDFILFGDYFLKLFSLCTDRLQVRRQLHRSMPLSERCTLIGCNCDGCCSTSACCNVALMNSTLKLFWNTRIFVLALHIMSITDQKRARYKLLSMVKFGVSAAVSKR